MSYEVFIQVAAKGFCLGFFIGILNLTFRIARRGVTSMFRVPGM